MSSLNPDNIVDNNEGEKVSNEEQNLLENKSDQVEDSSIEAETGVETGESNSVEETVIETPQAEVTDSADSAQEELETIEPVKEVKEEDIAGYKTDDIEEIEEIEEEDLISPDEDFSEYSKKDLLEVANKMRDSMDSRDLSLTDIKNIDNVIKVVRSAFEDLITFETNEAKENYIKENGTEEGFAFRNDNHTIRFEGILIQIRDKRKEFFKKLDQEREDYFELKSRLIEQLREIVEGEEKGETKNSWEAFKNIQTEWKNAGNISSPHNGSLWSAYNALVDRYFDIRSIQNELKELDRKKNLEAKEAVVVKIEEIATSLAEIPMNNIILKNANELLQEYKHIGPGPRAEQDLLWDRLKKAFDVVYDKKRELQKESAVLAEEVLNAKTQIFESLQSYLSFNSDSINEWNAKTREIQAIQEQWSAIKGGMPREKGKEISKNFWSAIKQFFKNKGEFFARLEEKREVNLEAKQKLVESVKEILVTEDLSPVNTKKIIEIQKKWKTIGHVPEKFKDSIYKEFKGLCDEYFDKKRDENKSQDKEYEENLAQKVEICETLEKMAKGGDTDLSKLREYKKKFNAIGFVPRKEIKNIQERFINAINGFVKSVSDIDKAEKEKIMLQNEAEVVLKSGGNLNKAENDIRRKIKNLEDDIALTKNNIEFFGFSKNAEKLKKDYQKKIDKTQKELDELNDKLRLIQAVN